MLVQSRARKGQRVTCNHPPPKKDRHQWHSQYKLGNLLSPRWSIVKSNFGGTQRVMNKYRLGRSRVDRGWGWQLAQELKREEINIASTIKRCYSQWQFHLTIKSMSQINTIGTKESSPKAKVQQGLSNISTFKNVQVSRTRLPMMAILLWGFFPQERLKFKLGHIRLDIYYNFNHIKFHQLMKM